MAFQFHCPHGHLLQGEEAHMGMQTQCPYCGVMFIIPVIDPQGMQAAYPQQYGMQYAPQQAPAQPGSYLPAELHDLYDPTATQPGLQDFLDNVDAGETAPEPTVEEFAVPSVVETPAPEVQVDEPSPPSFLHIPCPNGHELETPFDMLGQDVLCPHCGAQFYLREEDSVEHRVRQEELDVERGKFWFNWAIAAAVLVGGGLFLLMIIALSK